MDFYRQSAAEVCRVLGSGDGGLSNVQAQRILDKLGENQLDQPARDSMFQRFLSQMADPMILVLLAAAAISGLTAVCAGESIADVCIILAVVVLNAGLGVYQENKAEQAIEALQQLTAAQSRVLRDGSPVKIPSAKLVPGDVVLLEAGDAVPADGRVLESTLFQVEESALTGESLPTEKTADTLQGPAQLADRHCMVYMGSTVSYGRGRVIVTATGMKTEMGRIAGALNQTAQGKTPLQKRLTTLSTALSWLVLGISVFVFGFSLWKSDSSGLQTVLSCFMTAVSLAVAAVPEGLAAVVTIVLSMGVTRMSQHGAVIRRLTAVETLGCAQVICTDKTGTLTQNKMTVCKSWGDRQELARAVQLCNDTQRLADGRLQGDPTECALAEWAGQQGRQPPVPRVLELPFDSQRKMMSTFHREQDRIIQYTKGAPDVLLTRCTHCIQNGKICLLTAELRSRIIEENRNMGNQALRVLAAARREWTCLPAGLNGEMAEQQLIFLGLVGMMDPIRPEAAEAIRRCRQAGIRPVMITGDHRDTAAAIGRQLGILQSSTQAVTGAELDHLSEEQLDARVSEYSVYARVQPGHKTRIVKAWQKRGCVVAMAGDGVNDAPALKNADIGVGMGLTGTDVSRSVSDMILTDDNFATIVTAVSEGRRIYDNIRKAVQFLLASNLSEVASIFTATLLGIRLLGPAQLLWINLVTDCFPAVALGMEKPQPDLMQRPPRPRQEGIFAGGLGFDVLWQGLLVTLLTLASYWVGCHAEWGDSMPVQSGIGASMAFLTMSLAELLHSFNMRSQRQSLLSLQEHNGWLWLALLVGLGLTLGVMIWSPAAAAFGFSVLQPVEYGLAAALAAAVIPLTELGKALLRK